MPSNVALLDRTTLLWLRWGGSGVLAAVLAAGALGWLPSPPLPTTLGVLLAASSLNLALQRFGPWITGPVLLGDTAVLSWMLASSGGVSNPFTLLFLIPVLLAALVLHPAWSAVLTVVTTACFAALYLSSPPHHHMEMSQHLVGMVVAYGLTVPLLAIAVHRFRSAAAAADHEARKARESRAASERLTSLAALAGGAAHELATPLSTILLIARERERTSEGALRDDLAEIGTEVERCREILDQLAVEVGTSSGETPTAVELAAFVRSSLNGLPVQIEAEVGVAEFPSRLVAQALRRLVGNALDAGSTSPIVVRAAVQPGTVRFEVEDHGCGMAPDVLARACEPFFTTKAHAGRGLGLFFVHSLAQQLQGHFTLQSTIGVGTLATLVLPGGPPCASS